MMYVYIYTKQHLSFSPFCIEITATMHEIGHTMGLNHANGELYADFFTGYMAAGYKDTDCHVNALMGTAGNLRLLAVHQVYLYVFASISIEDLLYVQHLVPNQREQRSCSLPMYQPRETHRHPLSLSLITHRTEPAS
jgi:hypothetical protein